jgi:hypothetical protein
MISLIISAICVLVLVFLLRRAMKDAAHARNRAETAEGSIQLLVNDLGKWARRDLFQAAAKMGMISRAPETDINLRPFCMSYRIMVKRHDNRKVVDFAINWWPAEPPQIIVETWDLDGSASANNYWIMDIRRAIDDAIGAMAKYGVPANQLE